MYFTWWFVLVSFGMLIKEGESFIPFLQKILPRPDHIQGENHPGHLSHPPRPPPVGPRGRRRGRRGPGAGLLNPFIRNLAGKASEFIGCNENPCKNNGTCLAIGKQNCICANGWGGKLCEIRKNSSCSIPWCENNCPSGHKKDPKTNCRVCECADDPCLSKVCTGEMTCVLEKSLMGPAAVCKDLGPAKCANLTTCTKRCPFGFKRSPHHKNKCSICECANDPCQMFTIAGKSCSPGRVCVVERIGCYSSKKVCRSYLPSYRGVCRARNKPGYCPADMRSTNSDEDMMSDVKVNADDIFGSMVSADNACEIKCTDDSDCSGLLKCCSTGCGTQCIMPDFKEDTRCQVQREEAIENNRTSYIPQCDRDGHFLPVQCEKKWFDNKKCACVDIHTGSPIRGTVAYRDKIDCSNVDVNYCPKQNCNLKCKFGLAKDARGCPVCRCGDSPCKGFECAEGKICELMEMSCGQEECNPIPICVEEDWTAEKCSYGVVLRNEKTSRPVTCSQRIDDDDDKFKSDRKGGRKGWERGRKGMVSDKWGIYGKRSDTTEKKGNVCPQTHICTMDSKLGISVCCPRNTKEKMGFCPASNGNDKQQRTLKVDSNDPKSNPEQKSDIVKGEGLGSGGPWRKGGWGHGRFRGKWGNQGNSSARFWGGRGKRGKKSNSYKTKKFRGGWWKWWSHGGSCVKKCQYDSDCGGIKKCCSNGCGMSCELPQVNKNSTCQIRLDRALVAIKTMPSEPIFIPRCHLNGTYQRIQCFDAFGLCWCVNEDGSRVKGTMVRGTPKCNQRPKTKRDPPVCPSSRVVHRCSPLLCYEQTCMANQAAVCRINPCGNCTIEFYDKDNNIVDCMKGVSQCAKHEDLTKQRRTSHYQKHIRWDKVDPDKSRLNALNSVHVGHQHAADVQNTSIRGNSDEPRWKRRTGGFFKSLFNKRNNVTCPPMDLLKDNNACLESCQKDEDCGIGYICCKSPCGHICTRPIENDEVCLLLPPETKENCGKYSFKKTIWYYNQDTFKCEKKEITQCEDAWQYKLKKWRKYSKMAHIQEISENSFDSMFICQRLCQEIYPFDGMFVPECVPGPEGDNSPMKRVYKEMQCHRGMCWCMKLDGTIVDGSLSKGPVKCNNKGDVIWSLNSQAVCSNGEQPKICHQSCLLEDCDLQESAQDARKFGYPVCQADPCNDCEVTFLRKSFRHPEGTEFTCDKMDKCSVAKDPGHTCYEEDSSTRWYYNKMSRTCLPFSYGGCGGNENNFENAYDCHEACGGGPLCVGAPKPVTSLDDVCNEEAICEKFPEALCIPDLCTAQPRFFDIVKKQEVNCKDKQSLCHRLKADAMKFSALGDEESHIYECNPDGTFQPTQCNQNRSVCWCVNDNGEVLPGTKQATNQDTRHHCEKPLTKAVLMSFSIDEDIDMLEGKTEEFLQEWKSEISYTLDMDEEYITQMELEYVEDLMVVSFEVIPDGTTDLGAQLDYLKRKIAMEDFSVEFEGYEYWAVPDEIFLDQIRDALLDIYGSYSYDEDTTESGGSGGTAGIVVGSMVAGIFVCVAIGAVIFFVKRKKDENSDGMKTSFGTSRISNNGFEQFDNSPDPQDSAPVDCSDVTLDTPTSNSEA